MPDLHALIEWNMTNHAPASVEIIDRFEALRVVAKEFSHAIAAICPESPEQEHALHYAELALMHGVAAIARNQAAILADDTVATIVDNAIDLPEEIKVTTLADAIEGGDPSLAQEWDGDTSDQEWLEQKAKEALDPRVVEPQGALRDDDAEDNRG